MQSTAETVAEYLARLPQDRRLAIERVRRTILDDLPLDLIGDTIASMEVADFIALTETARTTRKG